MVGVGISDIQDGAINSKTGVIGQYSEAQRSFKDALETAWATQVMPAVLDSLIGMAAVLAQVCEKTSALELLTIVLGAKTLNKKENAD